MWSYEVWQLYILIIGTVWIGCRMTLFSVALHQHSFNLFISVLFQDKLSYSHESAVVPVSLMWNGSRAPGKTQDQIPNSSTLPPGPRTSSSIPPLEVGSRRDLFYSPHVRQSPGIPATEFLLAWDEQLLQFSPFCSTRREGAALLGDLTVQRGS